LLVRQGRLAEAASWGGTWVTQNGPTAEVWNALGQAYGGLGRVAEAEALFTKALELEPDRPQYAANRVTALRLLSRTTEAVKWGGEWQTHHVPDEQFRLALDRVETEGQF